MRFTMRRTWPDDDQPNDFVFRVDGRDAGRCYLSSFPLGERWLWTVYGSSAGGLEITLDDAKANFKATFERG